MGFAPSQRTTEQAFVWWRVAFELIRRQPFVWLTGAALGVALTWLTAGSAVRTVRLSEFAPVFGAQNALAQRTINILHRDNLVNFRPIQLNLAVRRET